MITVREAPIIRVRVKNEIVSGGNLPPYDGSYEFTPSSQEQTALTANKELSQNIVIHKIPNSYGLITYNGFEITVS